MRQKFSHSLLTFPILLALASLACGIDFGTPSPTTPPQPSIPETPAQSATPEKFFTEEFDAGRNNWETVITTNNNNAKAEEVKISDGNGRLIFDLGKNLNAYTFYTPQEYDNVSIHVIVENKGSNNNNINIVCRKSDLGWYEVSIANNGLYKIWAFSVTKGIYSKLADGGSNKIRPGKEINEFVFTCNERNLSLQINGVETRAIEENQFIFTSGQVGIGLSSFGELPINVEFESVNISQP